MKTVRLGTDPVRQSQEVLMLCEQIEDKVTAALFLEDSHQQDEKARLLLAGLRQELVKDSWSGSSLEAYIEQWFLSNP